jgi:AI-2 transport protein TqsA
MQNTPSAQSQNTQNSLIAACLLVIAAILLAVALAYTRTIMIPFTVALFLAYFVTPAVELLKSRLRFPHWAAVMGALSLFFLSIVMFVLIVRGSVIRIIDSFYLYEEKLARIVAVVAEFFLRFDIRLDQSYLLARMKDLPMFSYAQSVAGTAMAFLLDFMLVVIFLIFLVSGKSIAEKKSPLAVEIDAKIRGYILTKVATCMMTALALWIVFEILQLDMALMFALLSFFLGFIPTLGSIVATLLPLPIALVQYESTLPIVCVIAIPAFIQVVLGNILEPKLLGKGLDLHPITILISLMFWGLIWGVAGMFLAVPITAVLKIILEKIPLTRGLSEMLAGRSPI